MTPPPWQPTTVLLFAATGRRHRAIMEPPTMLLVPICRDMQLWWDKPQYRASETACQVRHVLMTLAGFALVWRAHKCMWLSKHKMFSIQKQSLVSFLNQPLCFIFFRYSFQYRRHSIRPSTQFIHFCRRSAVETIICLGPCTLHQGVWGSLMSA